MSQIIILKLKKIVEKIEDKKDKENIINELKYKMIIY